MHYVSDIQIIATAGAVVVHFVVSSIIGWRTLRKVNKNGIAIDTLHASEDQLTLQVTALEQTVANIKRTLSERAASRSMPHGRRATDGPPAMRDAKPSIAGLSPSDSL